MDSESQYWKDCRLQENPVGDSLAPLRTRKRKSGRGPPNPFSITGEVYEHANQPQMGVLVFSWPYTPQEELRDTSTSSSRQRRSKGEQNKLKETLMFKSGSVESSAKHKMGHIRAYIHTDDAFTKGSTAYPRNSPAAF